MVTVLAVVAVLACLLLVPGAEHPSDTSSRAGTPMRAAVSGRVLVMLAIGLVVMGGQFTAFTYLTPFLTSVSGVSKALVSVYLLVFGVAAALGTVIGGRQADRDPTRTLLVAEVALVAGLLALRLFGSSPLAAMAAIAVWGFAGFALVPALQLRIITLAGPGRDVAATLGASAVNAGIAAGALLGGAILAHAGARATTLAAAGICAVAFPVTWASRSLRVPVDDPGDPMPS